MTNFCCASFGHITDRREEPPETDYSKLEMPPMNVKAHFYEAKCNDKGCPCYGETVVWQSRYVKGNERDPLRNIYFK